MLAVIKPPDAFEWLGVGDVMQAEAEAEAAQALEDAAARARTAAGVEPEQVTRVGTVEEEILRFIEEDADVSYLVLAAATGKEGPGPLVSNVAGKAASTYPVPVIIVPGGLSDEEIDAIAG
jgi:nucleotide-binding universal stress UspA family protein